MIAARFGFQNARDDSNGVAAIKAADERALLIEARALMHDHGVGLREERGLALEAFETLPPLDTPLASGPAAEAFLRAHELVQAAFSVAMKARQHVGPLSESRPPGSTQRRAGSAAAMDVRVGSMVGGVGSDVG